MPVDYGALLSRSFQITFQARNRVLWVLGLLVTLLTGVVNTGLGTFRPSLLSSVSVSGPGIPASTPFIDVWDLLASWISLLLGLVFLLLRPPFEAGLISAADQSGNEGAPPFATAWAAGRARW